MKARPSNVIPLVGNGARLARQPACSAPAAATGWPFHFVSRALFERLTEFEKGFVENKLKAAIEAELIQRALRGPK